MAENNVWCKVCGTGYHVCKACGNIKSFTPWRMVADNINHYSIYLVLHQYALNKDKDKAKEELKKIDMSDKDMFIPSIKKQIEEIMSDDIKKTEIKETVIKTEEVRVEEPIVVVEDNFNIEEKNEVEEQPKKMKYVPKNKRKNSYALGDINDVE